jgi:hypothetical protein
VPNYLIIFNFLNIIFPLFVVAIFYFSIRSYTFMWSSHSPSLDGSSINANGRSTGADLESIVDLLVVDPDDAEDGGYVVIPDYCGDFDFSPF